MMEITEAKIGRLIKNLIKLKPGMPVKPRAPGEAPAGGDKPAADGKKG
jgi:membrane fusion protein (multidrug efflux system)